MNEPINGARALFTNQSAVITTGMVGWIQTFVDTTMPVIQWIVAVGTAMLVLFNVTLKGIELYEKLSGESRSSGVENEED